MADECTCKIAFFLLLAYVATTIVLYTPVNSPEWSVYQDGRSGLWEHCNETLDPDGPNNQSNEKKKGDDDDRENCDYISVSDAPGLLHVVRGFYLSGFILWCLNIIYRYNTWKDRGTSKDLIVAGNAVISAVFAAAAATTYITYFQEEFLSKDLYVNSSYGVGFKMAWAASACCILVATLTVINNRQMSGTPFACMQKITKCKLVEFLCQTFQMCKKKSVEEGEAQHHRRRRRQSLSRTLPSSARSFSRSSSTTTSGSTVRDASRLDAESPSSGETRPRRDVNSIRDLPIMMAILESMRGRWQGGRDTNEGNNGHSRGVAGSRIESDIDVISVVSTGDVYDERGRTRLPYRGNHTMPTDQVTLPPSYDEVVSPLYVGESNERTIPPPSYEEAIRYVPEECGEYSRNAVLSPPPAYTDSAA